MNPLKFFFIEFNDDADSGFSFDEVHLILQLIANYMSAFLTEANHLAYRMKVQTFLSRQATGLLRHFLCWLRATIFPAT